MSNPVVDQSAILHGTLNTNIDEIYTSLITCLQQYAAGMRELQNADYMQRCQIITDVGDFLDSLSQVSSICAFKWAFTKRTDYKQVQKLIDELINDKHLKHDLEQTKNEAQLQTTQQSGRISPQMRASLEEKDDKTYKSHKANVDSMPHDKMRSLGDFMEGLLNMHYLVPLEESLYRGFAAKTLPKRVDDENSYDELLRSKFGNTIYQPPNK